MRERVEAVAPDRGAIGFAEGLFETFAIDGEAVVFARERGDGADGACGFACELGRVFVRFLVDLVFEDDDVLEERLKGGVRNE